MVTCIHPNPIMVIWSIHPNTIMVTWCIHPNPIMSAVKLFLDVLTVYSL